MKTNANLIRQAKIYNKGFNPTTLVYYMRKADRTPYGVIVAVKMAGNRWSVGYHAVKRGEANTFNKQVGRMIATKRAVSYNNDQAPGYEKMMDRAARYLVAQERQLTTQLNDQLYAENGFRYS
jgi:hypothetical protein